MRAIFLPVWSTGILNRIYKWVPDSTPENGWFDRPPLSYGSGLLSYVDFRTVKDRWNDKDGKWQLTLPRSFPSGSYIFGDSGGFTLISNPTEVLDPIEVLQWQAAHVNVGAILDRPPRRTARRDWKGCLEFTLRNVERALPAYKTELERGNKFRWWSVLHGNTEQESLEWYEAITKLYPFNADGEGWAVYPGPQAHPFTVARAMRVLKQLGIKRAHFLACTGQDVISTILALGPQAGLELVTFDSMSHAVASINRWWFTTDPALGGRRGRSNEGLIKSRVSRSDYIFENVRCLGDLPEKYSAQCSCPVCTFLRDRTPGRYTDGPEQDGQGGWRDSAITLHNIYVQSRCILRQEEEARKDPEAFLRNALRPSLANDNEAKSEGIKRAAKTFRIFLGQDSDRMVSTGSNLGLFAR